MASGSDKKPVIVLVPGAFGKPSGFDPILPYLEKAGLATRPGAYPSCDPPDPAAATCERDVAALRDTVLLPLIEAESRDVVLLVHSYGGIVGGAAAKGLDKAGRAAARGQAGGGGVVGLIYVVGNLALEGESLFDIVGRAYPPFIKKNKPSKGLALIEPGEEILYNDCAPALAAAQTRAMAPHAVRAFETPASAPAWADASFDRRRAYVRALDDRCNPVELQDAWLAKTGVAWDVADFRTGHMPFVSQPAALAEQIVKFVDGFVALG